MATKYAEIRLKSVDLSRFARGSVWIYSNEIDGKLKSFYPGQLVRVIDRAGRPLGVGYVNPGTLIACRLLTRRDETIDKEFFVRRVRQAAALRARLGLLDYCRAVFSEGDMISGLIVDKYDRVLSVQLRAAGTLALRNEIISALDEVFEPEAIILKNDFAYADYEGIERSVESIKGKIDAPVKIMENNLKYFADVVEGQKTGYYFDQRENRKFAASLCEGKTVVDLFSYTGGFGVAAAAAGAKKVICVDSSGPALALARASAEANGLNNVDFVEANVFEYLLGCEEKFDVVLADPPAFIQSKSAMKEGLGFYHRLHALLMKVVKDDGVLVTSSCSYNLSPDALLEVATGAATKAGFRPSLFYMGRQSADHPLNPAMPETFYLKTFAFYMNKAL